MDQEIENWTNSLKIWNILNAIERLCAILLPGKVAKVPSAYEQDPICSQVYSYTAHIKLE